MGKQSARQGHFYAERQELELRYAYRPEYVPLLLDYLGARDGARILELGCGSGFVSRLLARALPQAEVVGVDSDERSLEIARELRAIEGGLANLRFERGDAYRIPFPDGHFGLATSHRLL